MERWRLIRSFDASPAFNMGLDEALLETPNDTPVLRVYSWSPDTLSLGYFQKFSEVPGTSTAGAVVRRITGGGAIHHTRELTFSITAPLAHPLYRGALAESYRRVHAVVADALRSFGVEPSLREERELASDVGGTGMCFHKSTALDIVWNERKGVGSAQRRSAGRVLHHGSIKLGSSELEGDIATVADCTAEPSVRQAAAALLAACETSWDVELVERDVSDAERERALELGRRYASESFLRRR